MRISPDHIRILTDVVHSVLAGAEIYVFGSFSKGLERRDSDLDIALNTSQPISLDVMAKIRNQFDESNLPYIVDLVDLSTMDAEFKKSIAKDLIRLV